MRNRYVLVLAATLTVLGVAMFTYKWRVLGFPLTDQQVTPTWTVETTIRFDSGPGSIRVDLQIPTLTPGFRTLEEYSVSRNYAFAINYVGVDRRAQWTVRRADGRQTLYYRIVVYPDRDSEHTDLTPPLPIPPVIDEPLGTAVDVIVSDVREHSADEGSFAAVLLRMMNNPSPNPNVELLLADVNTAAQFVERAILVLNSERIPARMVHAIPLDGQARNVQPVPWLEIHDGESWRFFNPSTGAEGLPDNYLIWWRGNQPLVSIEGGSGLEASFAVQRNVVDAMVIARHRAEQRESRLIDFSLFALPIQTQAVYGILIMIPIGALVMVFMRNVIGIESFGTFMPVLIALAFRETMLVSGIILFTVLVALGLSIRFLLERLRLLLVPRLAAVLIVVVLLMLIISIVSHQLGMATGLSVALFPMVIIAMTIERMSVVWEERGAGDAIKAGVGSMVVAVLAYIVMGLDWLEYLVFAFPELLLVVLAVVLLLGRYTGYRLSELRRFKALARP
ncbi:MAG TPA: UUP1 family membrane protein [Woeseiaceae bacterium]|nr:UUP1 family membrane protein [Woeseiaceae bacterium]